MDDIDNITSTRSQRESRKTIISDIDSFRSSSGRASYNQRLDSRNLNADEPVPQISPSRDLLDTIRMIDKKTEGRIRLPMTSSHNIESVRIIPDISSRGSNPGSGSARSYRPQEYPMTRKPDKNISQSERAYIWRMKFQRLNARNRNIPIPDSNDPDTLERLYAEAIRTDHYCSSTSTWLIYMGLGYGAFQYALNWMGIKLPPNFVMIQVQVMSHYPQLLKALGDPGGPSLGSSWPPWLKLMFVICVHTLLFIIVYKISGENETSAHNAQLFICKTGLMGGKPQGEEVEADNASMNLGGLLGGLGGIFGNGGGGIGGMFQNLLGGMLGGMGKQDNVDSIDLDNPEISLSLRSNEFNSQRKTPFD